VTGRASCRAGSVASMRDLICLEVSAVCRSNAQGLELSELMRRLADAARDGRPHGHHRTGQGAKSCQRRYFLYYRSLETSLVLSTLAFAKRHGHALALNSSPNGLADRRASQLVIL